MSAGELSRRGWLKATLAVPVLAACGGALPIVAEKRDARSLLTRLELADVDHFGPFVELGSIAADRHTLGGWRTGWGPTVERDSETWGTVVASPALVFAEPPRGEVLELRIDLAPLGARHLSVHVGGARLHEQTLEGGRQTLRVEIPATVHETGPFTIELRHDGPPGEAALAVRSLHLARGEGSAPPWLAELSDGDALTLRAPTRLSFPLEIGEGTRLEAFASGGPARLQVWHREAGGGRDELRSDGPVTAIPQRVVAELPPGPSRVTLAVVGDDGAEVRLARPRLTSPWTPGVETRPTARHVVVLLCDTLRADRLTAYAPDTRVHAPALAALASESVVFERAGTPANWTKPAVASLFTGRSPPRHGALAQDAPLPATLPVLAEALRDAGRTTAAFVANGFVSEELGFARGFDSFRSYFDDAPDNRASRVLDDAGRWLDAHRGERTFLYVHCIDPHVPYDPAAVDLARYDDAPYDGPLQAPVGGATLEAIRSGEIVLERRDRARLAALYDAGVTGFDRALGVFLEGLRANGTLDETLFVFVSDHGEELLDHGSVGHGHSLQEELLHVPLLVRPPGGRAARAPGVVSLVDLAPTILELAGAPPLDDLDGRSLAAELAGAPSPPDVGAFASQWDAHRSDELKWAARVGDLKMWSVGPRDQHLFDLASDPGERSPVDDPVTRRILHAHLGAHLGALTRHGRLREEVAPLSDDLRAHLEALGYVLP